MVHYLVPSVLAGDVSFVPTFLESYRQFATPVQVLDLLVQRYPIFHDDCEAEYKTKNALCSILSTWLDRYPQDFFETPGMISWDLLSAYVKCIMPGSQLEARIRLLDPLKEQQLSEAEPEAEEAWDLGPHRAPAPEQEEKEPTVMPESLEPGPAAAPAPEEKLQVPVASEEREQLEKVALAVPEALPLPGGEADPPQAPVTRVRIHPEPHQAAQPASPTY